MVDIERIPEITGISHIALVVPDIEIACDQFAALGYTEESNGVIEEKEYGIRAKIISFGSITIELLTPLANPETSPYADQLKQKRYCMDHICYEVSDLDKAIEGLKRLRFTPISQPRITCVWNRRAVLLANRRMGVLELMESSHVG